MDMFSQASENLKFYGILVIAFAALVMIADISLRRYLRKRRSGATVSRRTPQADALGDIGFQRQPLMNKTEYRVFGIVESTIARTHRGYRVMAQTSLGEMLRTDPDAPEKGANRAFMAINAKRLDIAIIDPAGLLALAIEVHGTGHYQSASTYIRDAVKKEALRRAGVYLLEITPDWGAERIAREVTQRLDRALVA